MQNGDIVQQPQKFLKKERPQNSSLWLFFSHLSPKSYLSNSTIHEAGNFIKISLAPLDSNRESEFVRETTQTQIILTDRCDTNRIICDNVSDTEHNFSSPRECERGIMSSNAEQQQFIERMDSTSLIP